MSDNPSDPTLPENVALPPGQNALDIALHGVFPRIFRGPDTTTPQPTIEQILGGPTIEEILAPPKRAVIGSQDWFKESLQARANFFSTLGGGFMRGYAPEEGFGLSDEDKKSMEAAGLKPFLQDAETNIGKAAQFAARSVLYGIPSALDAVARLPGGVLYAVGDLAVENGVPRDIPGMLEAFPAGHMAGYPGGIPTRMAQIRHWTRGVPEVLNLDKAAEAGAIEGVNPLGAMSHNIESGVAVPDPPKDLHEAARAVAPEVMARYEADVTRSDFIAGRLDELNQTLRDEPDHVKELRAAGKTDEAEGLMRGIRSEMTAYSKEQEALARRMDEHFPQVLDAYKRGSELGHDVPEGPSFTEGVPKPPDEGETAPVERSLDTAPKTVDETSVEKIAPRDGEEPLAAGKEMVSKVDKAIGEGKEVTALVKGEEVPIKEVQGNRLVTEDGRKLSVLDVKDGEVTIFHQRTRSIAVDAAKKAEVAGRPPEEAQAIGRLVQAYYRTLADKFEGKLGTADELYQKMAPRMRERDMGTTIQGRTIIGRMRSLIEVTKRADASTIPHELAHNWLEDMRGLVEHPEAPESLKADWETVKSAYRMPEKEGMSPQAYKKAYGLFQEKFARGFERYLIEGRAPSKGLDGVFRKFASWLTDIYQSALGIPLASHMTDAMRGVYGRLLAAKEREAIIAPDRVDLAEAHEAAAATVGLDESLGTANRMAAERAQVAEEVGKEVDDGRRDARRGPSRDDVLSGVFEETGADAGSGGEGEGTPTLDSGRDTSKAAKATPVGEPEPRTFVDAKGDPIPENINDEGDVAEAVRTLAGPDGAKRPLTDTEKMNVAREFGYNNRDLDGASIGAVWTPKQVLAAIEVAAKQQERVREAQQRVHTLTGGRDFMRDEAKANDPQILKALADYAVEKGRFQLITDTIVNTASNMGEAFRLLRFAKHLKTMDEALEFFQKTVKMSPEELAQEAALGLRVADRSQAARMLQRTSGIWSRGVRGVVELFLSDIFSGMVTQGINIIGNTITAALDVPETALARGISRARGQDYFKGEAYDIVHSLKPGVMKGLIGAGRALVDEGYAFRSENVRPATPDAATGGAIPNFHLPLPFFETSVPIPLGSIIRYPSFRLLAAGDEFFKGVAEMNMLHRVARRVARADAEREGYTGEDDITARQTAYISNPTESMLAVVRQHKRYQTFTNDLGQFGRSLQAAVTVHPMMSFIFPVVRTGINLFKYPITERTLLGTLSREQRTKLSGAQGAMVQNMAFSRQAIGNMALIAAGYMWYEGIATGGGPTNAGERETQRNVGIQPYAFNTRWGSFSYQAFEPFATILMLATDSADLLARLWDPKYKDMDIDEKTKHSNETAMRLSLAIQRNLFDKLALRSLSNMIEAIYSPETAQSSFVQSTVSAFVPNLFGQIATAIDPFERETRSWLDAMLAKVPHYRETLHPKYDRWGQPVPRQGVGQIRWRPPDQGDPVDNAMFRLGMNNAPPQRKIDGIGLTDDQYEEYQQRQGQLAKQFLDLLVRPGFENAPEGMQRKLIGDQIKRARDIARKQVIQGSTGQGEHDITQRKYKNELKLLK